MPALPTNPNGSLREFTADEVIDIDIRRRGSEDGTHVVYNFGPDGAGCVRKFSCAWEERFNAQIYFVGACKQWLNSGDPVLSRLVPQRDPDYPGWICTKCEIEPFQETGEIDDPVDGSEPYPIFARADLRCTYELVPFSVATDAEVTTEGVQDELERYVTKPGLPNAEVSSDVQYISLPGSTQVYSTETGVGRPAGVAIPFGIGFPESMSKFKVIWRRVPFEAWGPGTILYNRVFGLDEERGHVGAVNKTTFLGMWTGTVQLIGIEERALPDPTGIGYSWELGYVMQRKHVPFGHLGYYFHDTVAPPNNRSGYYQAQRPGFPQTMDIGSGPILDDDFLFHVREFADLFVIGSV